MRKSKKPEKSFFPLLKVGGEKLFFAHFDETENKTLFAHVSKSSLENM